MSRTAALTAAILLLSSIPVAADDSQADWTILMYGMADTDLEKYMVADLEEMAKAKPSDRVHVVMEFDRAEEDDEDEGYSSDPVGKIGDFTSTKRLTLKTGRIVELADLGELNMGDPKTLSDFLAWGVKRFPAKRYALVLQDHGDGWYGFGGDGSHEDDDFSLAELSTALESGLKGAGIARLDLLCFDCCLMGDLDVMGRCRPFARFAVASQESEPGEGWANDAWLAALAEHPEMPPEAIGKVICDTYQASFDESDDEEMRTSGVEATLAVIDLDKVPAVVAAATSLSRALAQAMEKDGRPVWEKIARARLDAEEYGGGDEPSYAYDLSHFATLVKGCGADAEAQAVACAVEAAVVHHISGRGRPMAAGLSVYLPRETESFDEAYRESTFAEDWAKMIDAYLAIQAADEEAPEVSDPVLGKDTLGKGEFTRVTAGVEGSDVAETYFVLAQPSGDEQIILGMLPAALNGKKLESRLKRTWLAIGDKKNQFLASIVYYEKIEGEKNKYTVDIDAKYRGPKGGRWQDITLSFEVEWTDDSVSGEFVQAYRNTEDGLTPMEIRKGGKIRPVYTVVNADGEEEERTLDDAPTLKVGEDGVQMLETELPAGTYDVGFVAVDLAGNMGEAYAEVEVK